MKRIVLLLLIGMVPILGGCQNSASTGTDTGDYSSDKSDENNSVTVTPTPEPKTYEELIADYDKAEEEFQNATKDMSPDQVRLAFKLRNKLNSALNESTNGLRPIFEKHEGDFTLEQIVVINKFQLADEFGERAMETLTNKFAGNDKILPMLETLPRSTAARKSKLEFLDAVIEQNDNDSLVAVAKCIKSLWILESDPELAEKYMLEIDEKYADVDFAHGKLVDLIKKPLFAMKHLGVGKVAHNISGPDTDGKEFSLKDYEGKVIMLDFWGDW